MMNFEQRRKQLVVYLERIGVVATPQIKNVLLETTRELFIPEQYRESAYEYNTALPIPGGMTISAMNMHATFLSALMPKPDEKVLEIGAGSGIMLVYMKEMVGEKGEVFGIEIVPETYEFAKENLKKAGYNKKVKLILGDGSKGLPEFAPFDKILSSASVTGEVPKAWLEQLKVGGILVTPIGKVSGMQDLFWIKKTERGLQKKNLGGVVFVELQEK